MNASSRHQSDGCKCQSHGGAEVKHAPMNSIVHGAARPAEYQQQSSSTSKQQHRDTGSCSWAAGHVPWALGWQDSRGSRGERAGRLGAWAPSGGCCHGHCHGDVSRGAREGSPKQSSAPLSQPAGARRVGRRVLLPRLHRTAARRLTGAAGEPGTGHTPTAEPLLRVKNGPGPGPGPAPPMTDLLHVLPDFDTTAYAHLLPSLDKALISTNDLVTLAPAHVAKRAQVPAAELRKLVHHVVRQLHRHLGFGAEEPLDSTTTTTTTSSSAFLSASRNAPVQPECLSTLDPGLDHALLGGIRPGYLVEVAGERYEPSTLI